jgi:hypothetical protein
VLFNQQKTDARIMIYKTTSAVTALIVLSACGGGGSSATGTVNTDGSGSNNDGAFVAADGTFFVLDDGERFELPSGGATANGQKSWISTNDTRAGSYSGTNVLAIGGMTVAGDTFSETTGTFEAPPTATTTFTGRYTVVQPSSLRNSSPVTYTFDVANDQLTMNDGDASLVAKVEDDNELEGTFTYAGAQAELEGGFFAGGQVAGDFEGDDIAGVFYGSSATTN